MTFKCKNCTHDNVCKHQESYKKTLDSMNTKIPTPFSISLECPFYSSVHVQGPSLWGNTLYLNSDTDSTYRTTLEGVNSTDGICGTVALNDSISDLSTSAKATRKSK